MVDTGSSGCDFSYSGTDCGYNVQTASSEMAHLWYVTLGNKAICYASGSCPQAGWGLFNTADFLNLQSSPYWSGTEYAPSTDNAWYFHTYNGGQSAEFKGDPFYAMVVRPGDVAAAVPEPESLLLMLAGLCALVVLKRRQPFGPSAL